MTWVNMRKHFPDEVLVRLIVRDSPEQVWLAESFIANGAWVSHLVLAEAMWVLDAAYDRTPEQIAGAIDMLLNHKDLAGRLSISRRRCHRPPHLAATKG
jgi:predicted nucleic-acid-binding protein